MTAEALCVARREEHAVLRFREVKFWLVSDIDVASATFLAKFHVIMEWVDQAGLRARRNQTGACLSSVEILAHDGHM